MLYAQAPAVKPPSFASPNAAALGKYGDIPVSYHTGVPEMLSIFDKLKRLVGNERLQNKLNHIFEERMEAVQNYLFKEKQSDPNRIRIEQPKELKEVSYESLSRMISKFYVEE